MRRQLFYAACVRNDDAVRERRRGQIAPATLPDHEDEPEPDDRAPQIVDWDRLDAVRLTLFP